ncbi:26S proteasome regulatory complex, non-ATPase subcomplex, Rpn2/Psmd1 subunit [Trichodelitschia bisporula]|uniref:26S proteasome regulatory subunit RPN2 n=1 Tax=Trichodelitschia bisporula TaxID=703511 RepID=A0A6G1I3T7_9PEZI|nr:26S proteasome regulatory complex, non-ATPase subcomplex, Rpn2/Psmd1 subunit [Trichodelitschia bisporula]
MAGLTSAAGLVGLLSEPVTPIQRYALHKLNNEIDYLWPEVSASIDQIEALYEDESFPEREMAALVASKVYYQLQEYNESMQFALCAGKLFNLDSPGEYENTIITKCIDTYILLSAMHHPPTPAPSGNPDDIKLTTSFTSKENGSASQAAALVSPTTPFSHSTLPSKSLLSRPESSSGVKTAEGEDVTFAGSSSFLQRSAQKQLHSIIRRLFESCYKTGNYRQVVGIAIEARNLEVLREAILRASKEEPEESQAGKGKELMEYVLDICMNVVQERGLRNEILRLILDLLNDIPNPDYFSIAKCVVYLDQHSMASNMLKHLVNRGDARSRAIAYQLSFDLYDNGTQEFLSKVMKEIPDAEKKEEAPAANGSAHGPKSDEPRETDHLLGDVDGSSGETTMVSRTKQREPTEEERKAYSSIKQILEGSKSIELNLEFLYRNNRADKSILNKVRESLEARNSIFHTAVTFANAFMNSGTTNDSFFRENLEWLGKAVNWSKFTATAALGVIHRGNISQGKKLLEPYLPKENTMSGGSVYSQGGSLYALGLIYANHGAHVLDYLQKHFTDAREEVVQHGGALGMGVAGMGTGSETIYEELKTVLYSDSAINGEAVGVAMGLINAGTGSIKVLEDMIQYAHDTKHEKIIRGLGMGMALVMYARQEAADELINGLLDDPDPSLRYGGIMTIALAYCGSGSNKAVRKLLHVAVSDVSDDVRRAAVMSLGFVLFRKPASVPRMVELLAESYNPHVRYGATMALGIACAGTGLDEAIDLLEPMMKDSVDFVRQGALISLAMIMVQQNEAMNPKVASIRKMLQKAIGERHEDAMAKFGCALALGIIDAGGRNCTIGMQTQTGNLNMTAIIGMALFTQYWYWFPMTHFLSLAFIPTSIIAVDENLEIPSFKFHSATRPSMFDYPPEQEVKAEEAPEKVKTAVLSTTAQAKRRKQAKERQQARESTSMEVDQTPTTPKVAAPEEDKMDIDDDAKAKEEKAEAEKETTRKKVEKEKVGYDLENMSRVLPSQLKYISFPGDRYVPVKKPTGGVVLVYDSKPSEPKTLLERKLKKAPAQPEPSTRTAFASALSGDSPQTPVRQTAGSGLTGAAAAAGVLTAVDEDEEHDGQPFAVLPDDFDYFTDNDEESGE